MKTDKKVTYFRKKYPDCIHLYVEFLTESALSGLREFLANESPLNMMKNAFYFTFVLKIFKCLFRLFGHVEKQLD